MARGRPPEGPGLVDGLDGSGYAKKRLRTILETITGSLSIAKACEALGISRAVFCRPRNRVLETALGDLEPKPSGRPAKRVSGEQKEISDLKAELVEMRMHLVGAQIREEIALAMPNLLTDKPGVGKKKPKKRKKRKK